MKQLIPALIIPVLLLGIVSTPLFSFKSSEAHSVYEESNDDEVISPIDVKKIYRDSFNGKFIFNDALYGEGWYDLSQVKFWRDIFTLSPEISIINISTCRTVLGSVPTQQWTSFNDDARKRFRDSIISTNNLDTTVRIFVTSGKSHFYKFHMASPHIPPSIEVFKKHGVDPWYAQTILLIESPGNNYARSTTGAVGPFQLMRANAVRAGLTVNTRVDERSNLERSAFASAKLIKDICLPQARRIADRHGLEYEETDLWFRLLVLHIYHAGGGNVSGVVDLIAPTEGGMELIQQMWQTQFRGFKNQSQNYSQIALAALLSKQFILQQDTLVSNY